MSRIQNTENKTIQPAVSLGMPQDNKTEKFKRIDHDIGTRSKTNQLLEIKKSNHNFGKFAFSNRAAFIANALSTMGINIVTQR